MRYLLSFVPQPRYALLNSPCYPLDRRLVGPQIWSGYYGEHINSQPLQGIEPLIIQSVSQLYVTDLSRILKKAELFTTFCLK